MPAPTLSRSSLAAFAEGRRGEYESLLRSFVEIPTVSADPTKRDAIRDGVALAAETIRRFGGAARIVETRGNPLVDGVFGDDPGLPTVTVYNHLDVQPASRETEPWETEPFRLTVRGDRYFGRGTTDDKGPALAALYGIRAALDAGVRANLRVLWELEEEIGSPSFERALRASPESFATDSVVVSDTIWVARGRPAAPAGLRGLQGFTLSLETGATDQHSGVVGGAARNPVAELMQVVSECFDARTGRVRIPGFYDDVVAPSRAELDDFRRSGFTVARFKRDHALRSLRTNDALDVMKRIWAQPTFEVHGMVGGYIGPGVKTVVPPRAEVKVSCRLVPNQRGTRVLALVERFVRARNPDVRIHAEQCLEPYRGHTAGPHADAIRRAIRFAFGRPPVFVREGGSIGAVTSMERVLGAPVLFLGLSLPEHGYHAPNENFDWEQASGGMAAFARYFAELAELGKLPRAGRRTRPAARPRRVSRRP
ncbi:MAG TPA: M20/M25/M40 family metallo-hydrolase [Myxococcota bacterium]|nr:M20/M25/M40 family metallo-hydrolase [Myxococcota bacterium]